MESGTFFPLALEKFPHLNILLQQWKIALTKIKRYRPASINLDTRIHHIRQVTPTIESFMGKWTCE